jgi:hypothetical protein
MNSELIYIVSSLILPIVLAYIGYRLGLRSQRIQALREYVTSIVRENYQPLFSEIKRNSERLDNYLEKPDVSFSFPEIGKIYDKGLNEFMKRYHKDLFLFVDYFQKGILHKFNELDALRIQSRERIFDIWSKHLRELLPREVADTSESIAEHLVKITNPYYVLPHLLNRRKEETRNRIEGCVLDKTSHIYREKAKRPFIIRGRSETINFDKISQSLIEKADPEITNFLEAYNKLNRQNEREVRGKLLPLLQKYISNPF